MKRVKLITIFCVAFVFFSCNRETPAPYQYASNPQFAWGYVEFFGKYYSNYLCQNNVLTVSLLTKNLKVDNTNSLAGTGQYLILEDVFVNPTDTILPSGTYTLAETKAPFTFFGGREFKENSRSKGIPSGAYIYYIESDATKSKITYITAGSFDVSMQNDTVFNINCNFTLDGKQTLKGTFNGVLYHFDESANTPAGVKRGKRFVVKGF